MIIVIMKELRSKTDHYQSNKASGSQIVGIIGKKNKEESSKYASIFDWIPSGPLWFPLICFLWIVLL